jgi:hypothetical protein
LGRKTQINIREKYNHAGMEILAGPIKMCIESGPTLLQIM